MFLHFCAWLQQNSIILALDNSVWFSALLEICHYTGFFLLVGTIAIVDLRIMGVAAKRQEVTALGEQMFPLMWTGLIFSFASGFLMFAGDATDFALASVFHIKVGVIVLAMLLGIVVQWNVPRWGQMQSIPISAKLLALVSLVLWIGAILASVEVPAISGVG
jgi:uncharacterized membrane protein